LSKLLVASDVRFSANVSMLYREVPFLERFSHAALSGFSVVEFWWPSGEDLSQVEAAVKDVALGVAVINFDAGNMAAGDRGLLSDPARTDEFRRNVPIALGLAHRLGCRRINALVGNERSESSHSDQLELARENVAWAADAASRVGIDVLVEALNPFENPSYLLSTTTQARDFIGSVGRKNLRLQADLYHMQRSEGNLIATLREHIGQVGHIQIADSPGRGEPGTGEINFPFVFAAIDDLGYEGYVGLEYKPTRGTEESLNWLPHDLRGGATGSDRPASP
jgi:hydroxypyruvate isomerase